MFKCSSWIYAWVPLPRFLFEDWFVFITLKFHYQLRIFRAILKITKREHCICVYVCVLVRETLIPCARTLCMCVKEGRGAWIANVHKTFDHSTFNSFQKMNNKYNEIDMIKCLPSTCVTFMWTISRSMLCIRWNHLTKNKSKWTIFIENRIVHNVFLKRSVSNKQCRLSPEKKMRTFFFIFLLRQQFHISSIAYL